MHTGRTIPKGFASDRRKLRKRRSVLSTDSQGWRLPSGEELEEFALQGGMIAPLMSLRALEMRVSEAGRSSESETTPAGGCR